MRITKNLNPRHRAAVAVSLLASVALAAGVTSSGTAAPTAQPVVVNADPVDWTPHVLDGQVNAIAQIGTRVFVGGTFTRVREATDPTVITRNYLFAFDTATQRIDAGFIPTLNGTVETLAASTDGQSLYVGGGFTTVDGKAIRKIARLDPVTGLPVAGFSANANNLAQDMMVKGGWLYVSGKFTAVRGVPRSGLARLNPGTGVVDPNLNLPFTDPPRSTMRVPHFDVSPDGTKLVAVGGFSKVGGVERTQIAMLDLTKTPVALAPWHTNDYPVVDPADPTVTWCSPNFPTWVRDADFSPDGSYFVVVTGGANRPNRLCDTAARWETTATGMNLDPTWVDWTGGDSLTTVAVTGTAVYIGGHQQWMNNPYIGGNCGVCPGPGPGGVARSGIAALDPINGLPLSWNPGRARGLGIWAFLATADGLWQGSDSDTLGGETHRKLGFFPLDGGASVPIPQPYALTNDFYSMDLDTGELWKRSYDLSTFGPWSVVPAGVDWRDARGAFALDGKLYTGWANGKLYVRDFDGSSTGPATEINLNGLQTPPVSVFTIPGSTQRIPGMTSHLLDMTGMFYRQGRIYYTVAGDSRLFYRYFTPESQILGANIFVASTGDGVSWTKVRGMTMASGFLVYATAEGKLWRVAFNGKPVGQVTQIGGQSIDGMDWASRGFFSFGPARDPA